MCCVANLPVSACLSLAIRHILIYALYGACLCTQSYYSPPLSSCGRCLQSCVPSPRWTVILDHNGDEHSRLFFRCFLLYPALLCRCCCCAGVVSDARAASRCCAAFVRFLGPKSELFLPILFCISCCAAVVLCLRAVSNCRAVVLGCVLRLRPRAVKPLFLLRPANPAVS